MITAQSVVVGIQPRITLETFTKILEAVSSPALVDSQACYQAIVGQGVDPAYCLASFAVESAYGTIGICHDYDTRNPGNCRSSSIGIKESITDSEKGTFVKYIYWRQGFQDMAHRLVDKRFPYAQAGAKTIKQILPLWAPGADSNSPDSYVNTVINLMNRWIGNSEVTNKMSLKIALAAGHHNSDGGSQVEAAITGPLCHFYAMAFKAAGCDVRVITPNDGLGMYPGGLQDVAQKVVDWANAGWTADVFLECHTQGLGDTSVRGAFSIYPDWGGDTDTTVRDGLGLAIVKAIKTATGIPVWSSGIMSEKATGVGISGFRLGIFLRTAPIASKTTRLIVEHGAHTNREDLALLQNPDIQMKIANAGALAITSYLGGTSHVTNEQPPKPVLDKSMLMNNFVVAHGMLDYWNKVAVPGVQHPLGLPISEEQDWVDPTGKKLVIQAFERGILGYDASITDPAYRVQGLITGPEWVKNHLAA